MFWNFRLDEQAYDLLLERTQENQECVDKVIKDEISYQTGDPNPHSLVRVVSDKEECVITLNIPGQET